MEPAPNRPRGWLLLAAAGCGFVVLALAVSFLVIIDKPRFGAMVGRGFLQIITSGVLIGAVLLLVGAWNLPERKSWRGVTLLVWGLIALTSPAFGFLFLLPWALLAVTLPLVIAILVRQFRRA